MAIDVLATRSHYLAHLAPVLKALPRDRLGVVYGPGSRGMRAAAKNVGLEFRSAHPPRGDDPVLCAAGNDLCYADERPVVLLEHGAGQTYIEFDDVAYAGGPKRDRVALFCHAREETAARDRARYPEAQVEIVGCPRLDAWHSGDLAPYPNTEGVLGVTWHWPASQLKTHVPEARWAWPSYGPAALKALAKVGPVLAHAHPRAQQYLWRQYGRSGVEVEWDVDRFFSRIGLLAADNTSALPEYASATGRPLLFLNAPYYRRDVEHGGRFWDWPAGQVSCDSIEELTDRAAEALEDAEPVRAARAEMSGKVYELADGRAGLRVAGLVLDRWG